VSQATLRAAIEATTGGLAEAEVVAAGADVTWRRRGVAFAELGRDGLAIRVGMAIAAAAVGTPDTRPSARGPDWIEFAPVELDDHALDRLDAWLTAAHRRAGG